LSINYKHTTDFHNFSAAREIIPLLLKRLNLNSVLDVGCGTGTWLKVFEENGVEDYFGVDSPDVSHSILNIPTRKFLNTDLRNPLSLGRKFDLVLSLEVAEHLPPECADLHVKSLTDHGNIILFSAAIPGQGGQNHFNEQWPSWWKEKFLKYGFYFHDVIRPQVWNNENVDWWYRQNIFLVTNDSVSSDNKILDIVHPELVAALYKRKEGYINDLVEGKQGVKIAIRIFINAVLYKLRSLFR
jgi:SAM-dependent methyltransferase